MTNTKRKTVLMAGCGDIGFQLGEQLSAKGYEVTGLKRTPVENAPFNMLYADLLEPDSLKGLAPQYDFVVYTATPDSMTPEGYQNAYVTALGNLVEATAEPAQRCFLVSSTGVYHQSAGEVVDETSPTEPSRFSGKAVFQSERLVKQQWPKAVVVRFAGIYGPGRLRLVRKVEKGEPVIVNPPKYTNRIFRDDCVGLLAFLMEKSLAGVSLDPVYLGCDDASVPDIEVLDFIAARTGMEPLPRKEADQDNMSQNKRCSNKRIKALGYEFAYPTYREGYERILKEAGLIES